VTVPVLGTNLLLIMASVKGACVHPDLEANKPVDQGPFRISESEERRLICNLAKPPHKRMQSYGCYDHDEKVSDFAPQY
jgi:hypothetical protein